MSGLLLQTRRFTAFFVFVMPLLVTELLSSDEVKTDRLTFESSVLPIFKAKCISCHSGEDPKGELNLTRRSSLLRGGKSGASIRLRAAESSLLWERIAADEMPAKGPPLTAAEKGVIRAWINEGASGDEEDQPTDGTKEATSVPQFSDDERKFWSFIPPSRPQLPKVNGVNRLQNPIDAFVLVRLENEKLSISPTADRTTLIRRAYYDLVGLPPSPDEVMEYLADPREDAYERLIDRLLSSPHYGERWGRHWLDVAGYSDSAGILNEDRPLEFAFRYRDYVIQAFNKDKPYDRFLQEQIAGDELVDYWTHFENDDQLPAEVIEGVTATGYLRCAADSSRPDFNTIKNADAQYFYPTINDTIKIVSTSTLGLTLQCARCHNHMYDPIPQEDFYRVQAIFMGAYRPTNWIPQMKRRIVEASKSQIELAKKRNAEVDVKVAEHKKSLQELREQSKSRLFADRLAKLPEAIQEDVQKSIETAADQRSEVQKYLAEKFQSTLTPDDKTLDRELLSTYPEYKQSVEQLDGEVAAQERRRMSFDEIRALYDLPGEVPTPLLHRGDALIPGRNVAPGTISVLEQVAPFEWTRPSADAKTSGRRLAFARWLTQANHPLTARVMVNRIWLHHLGAGIVTTPGDFGQSGARPTHPKLLDWLATNFVANDWSVKHMHRTIMTSSTYRQSSRQSDPNSEIANPQSVDQDNRLLWRQRIRRLEAEPMRDAVLCVAGTLNRQLLGHPIRMQRHGDGEVTTVSGSDAHRRSVYLQVLRLTPLTMLNNFDQPVMETNCALRSRSTVATQALTLLNSDAMIQAAEAMAQRVADESEGEAVSRAVWFAFSREPTQTERQTLVEFLKTQANRHCQSIADDSGKPSAEQTAEAKRLALADVCHMLLSANEFVYVD